MNEPAVYPFPTQPTARRFIAALGVLWLVTPALVAASILTSMTWLFFVGWILGVACFVPILGAWRRWFPEMMRFSLLNRYRPSPEERSRFSNVIGQVRAGISASGWSLRLVGPLLTCALVLGITTILVSTFGLMFGLFGD